MVIRTPLISINPKANPHLFWTPRLYGADIPLCDSGILLWPIPKTMNDINPTLILGASGRGTTILLNELVNPALATVSAVLTILILLQKLYSNWKEMKGKK